LTEKGAIATLLALENVLDVAAGVARPPSPKEDSKRVQQMSAFPRRPLIERFCLHRRLCYYSARLSDTRASALLARPAGPVAAQARLCAQGPHRRVARRTRRAGAPPPRRGARGRAVAPAAGGARLGHAPAAVLAGGGAARPQRAQPAASRRQRLLERAER